MSRSRTRGFGRIARGGASSLLLALVCLLAGVLQVAPAAADCPNEVFRTGPSAKLPECRAYELVTPEYTGGIYPSAINFFGVNHPFPYPLINAGGDSVIWQSISGALSGTPGNGFTDRYRAKRTPEGWVTELIGPTSSQTPRAFPGGSSPDHEYYLVRAGNGVEEYPDASLQAPFGGRFADYIRKPDGSFELIAVGSLGSSRVATGYLVTSGGSHVIFSTPTKLEPQAPPSGQEAIYDRSVGGPTHVVSLLPGNVTPTEGEVLYLGASEDANDIAFGQRTDSFSQPHRFYVRHANTSTREVARTNGAVVGKELSCQGSGGTSVSYQWLRDGAPIGGATSATYTIAVADEGDALQCQVTASSSEGKSIQASLPPVVVEPYEGLDPPYIGGSAVSIPTAHFGYAEVGEALSCEPGPWKGSPTYAYQWFRDGTEIAGANAAAYTPVGADEQTGLQCRLTASNPDGTVVGFSEVVPVHATPVTATADPSIANLTDPGSAPEAGDELSCSQGTWSGSPTFGYQWLRNGAAIGGATGSTYTVVAPADNGATLQCAVSAAAGGLTAQATSGRVVAAPQPGTASPEPLNGTLPGRASGSGRVGEALSCQAGEWSGEPSIGFQWLRNGAEIAGATEEAYVPTDADLGAAVQCRVSAANAGGTAVATYAGTDGGPFVIFPAFPSSSAQLAPMGLVYGGIFGGNVFYGDPGDLYSFNIADGTTTQITDVGDAEFSYVPADGSRVYFISESEIDGEGSDGERNLFLWSRAAGSTKFIATLGSKDPYHPNLTSESADGSTFVFTTSAQLTSFNNTEASPEKCGFSFLSGEGCTEIYRYELASEELTCISCPPGGSGPATGFASFYGGPYGASVNNPPTNVMPDGKTVFFQSTEDLLPQDGNQQKDVYRWKEGAGLALISTGQAPVESQIYAITPNGSDVAFITAETLVPEDVNGGTNRIYDARVNGGFPPPESTVTEPCSGDACQGNPSAAPEAPAVPSSSLNGGGNVPPKLHCPKGKRRVVRHGKQRCVKRKHHHQRKRKHAQSRQGAAR